MNNAVLIGRLTRDPDLRYLSNEHNNTAVANFTIAVGKGLSRKKEDEFKAKGKPTADFINVTVWGRQAENVASFLGKGSQVAVQGRIQTGSYEKDGQRHNTFEIVANSVQFLERVNEVDTQQENKDFEEKGFYEVDQNIPF